MMLERNLGPHFQAERFVAYADAFPHLGGRHEEDYRKCLQVPFPVNGNDESLLLWEHLQVALVWLLDEYRASVPVESSGTIGRFTHVERPTVLRYDHTTEDRFHLHCDAWNAGSAMRQLAVIVGLNDVTDGGETRFPVQERSIRPRRANALVFPASFQYPHEVVAPRSGPKYCIVTWIRFPELEPGESHYGPSLSLR